MLYDPLRLIETFTLLIHKQKYHSLAAKGEKVDVATLQTELNKLNGNIPSQKQSKGQPVQNSAEIDLGSDITGEEPNPADKQTATTTVQPAAKEAVAGPMLQALAGTGELFPTFNLFESRTDRTIVQDEDMKNLMMSWYYAGYYTGLYEGKQQGYAAAKTEQKSG